MTSSRSDELVMQEPARQETLSEARLPSGWIAWALGLLGGPLALHRFYLRRPAWWQWGAPLAACGSWLLARRRGGERRWLLAAAAIGAGAWVAELVRLPRLLRARRDAVAAEAQSVLDRERIEMERAPAAPAGGRPGAPGAA